MSGIPENNYPAFRYAFRRLRDAGFDVVSPHLLEANITVENRPQMTRAKIYRLVIPGDIAAVSICDAMMVLPGFEVSSGTALEMHAAELFEMEVVRPDFESNMIGLEQWMDLIIAQLKRMERTCQ